MDPSGLAKVLGVDKLLDYTASGIGAIAGPMLAPWSARRLGTARVIEARADGEAMRIAAQAQASSLQIIEEAQAAARSSLRATDADVKGEIYIGDRIEQSIQYREAKRLANLGTIVESAADQLGDAEVPDKEPNHDWTARFFGDAQEVSSEDMQALYSKVLAGEVERPGSTSMHTLSALRDLSSETASLFAILCSLSLFYTVNDVTIHDGRVVSLGGNASTNDLSEYGLAYDALIRLEEHGLITSDYNSWRDYGPFPNLLHELARSSPGLSKSRSVQLLYRRQAIKYAGDTWYLQSVEDGSPIGEIKINGVAMSHAGRELSKVVTLTPDTEYTAALATFLMGKGLELRRIHDYALLGHDE